MDYKKERVIINLATDNYKKSRKRLYKSLQQFPVDKLFWTKESDVGSPSHRDNPYAFKVYAFKKAIELGYKKILWLDSSVFAIRNISPVFDIIDEEGYIMQYAGHLVGNWANDKSLEYFGISRDDAMRLKMYGNAGFLGLNMDFEVSRKFFEMWEKSMFDGMFIGNWRNENNTESQDERCNGHRHDMTNG